jgi:hypothetical protein
LEESFNEGKNLTIAFGIPRLTSCVLMVEIAIKLLVRPNFSDPRMLGNSRIVEIKPITIPR